MLTRHQVYFRRALKVPLLLIHVALLSACVSSPTDCRGGRYLIEGHCYRLKPSCEEAGIVVGSETDSELIRTVWDQPNQPDGSGCVDIFYDLTVQAFPSYHDITFINHCSANMDYRWVVLNPRTTRAWCGNGVVPGKSEKTDRVAYGGRSGADFRYEWRTSVNPKEIEGSDRSIE